MDTARGVDLGEVQTLFLKGAFSPRLEAPRADEPIVTNGRRSPERRKHFCRYPFTKPDGVRLPALKYERIEAGLGNNHRLLVPTKGISSTDTLFIFVQPPDGFGWVC